MFMIRKFLRDIRDHKDLIIYLTISKLKANTARTYVGFLWWVIDPILYMAIFYLLVHVILGRGGPLYPALLFSALIPLKWTVSCFVEGTTAISGNSRIIQQVFVPKIVFILVRLLGNTLKFLIGSIVVFAFMWAFEWYSNTFRDLDFTVSLLSSYSLMYILIIPFQMIFLLACMVLLAHFGAYFRDIKLFMSYVGRMFLYVSPVLYTLKDIPISIRDYFYINPMTSYIGSYRNVLLEQQGPMWINLFVLFLISIVLLYIGLKLIFRQENEYAKVI